MYKVVRILMWTHFIYLLLLPTLAVISAKMLFPSSEEWQMVALVGFPATLMYSLFLANGYAMPDSLPVAILQTFAIPAQIALGVWMYGGGSIWLFFAESAAVAIAAFVLGVMTAAMTNRASGMKSGCSLVGLLVLAVGLFVAGSVPFILIVFMGYGGWSPWLVLFVTSLATAYWEYASSYRKLTVTYKKKKEPQNLAMVFDGGGLFKLLGINTKAPLISPVWSETIPGPGANRNVYVFGVTAMFLPAVAGMVIGIVSP
jgi:hypothetical protein